MVKDLFVRTIQHRTYVELKHKNIMLIISITSHPYCTIGPMTG